MPTCSCARSTTLGRFPPTPTRTMRTCSTMWVPTQRHAHESNRTQRGLRWRDSHPWTRRGQYQVCTIPPHSPELQSISNCVGTTSSFRSCQSFCMAHIYCSTGQASSDFIDTFEAEIHFEMSSASSRVAIHLTNQFTHRPHF